MKSFEELWEELNHKATIGSSDSRSAELIQEGPHAIGKKIVEEAAEVWMAAEHESKESLALEISQLIYYLQLIAISKGVELDDIYREL